MSKQTKTSWDSSDQWYDKLVGETGHYYHREVIFPNLKKMLEKETMESWLDLGCGNGVLARHLPKDIEYIGVDSAKGLLAQAKKNSPKSTKFILSDVSHKLEVEKKDFSHASFILSLQNMEDGKSALKHTSTHLKSKGKLFIILNHPSFRIPRQTEWGYDERTKTQFRKLNAYMSTFKIPITMHPGKKSSFTTYSFHHPLSTYSKWLSEASMNISLIEEWCSNKKSEGARAKSEDRARKEFPLFLAIVAEKK